MKCGKELYEPEEEYCYDCKRIHHCYDQGAAAFVYSEGIKESIYRYKYKNRREYAGWYVKEIARACGGQIRIWAPQVIVPVPLHESKMKKRGYNQAELIAGELGKCLDIPVRTDLLRRVRKTTPMKALGTKERVKNLENAFIISGNSVKYNQIMLVDDIYTTGTTVDACAGVLKDKGAKKVYFVCLCVGRGI